MKRSIPWMLCAVLATALIFTNIPNRGGPNEQMPADFAQFSHGTRWTQIYKHNGVVIWKMPAYGPKDCYHGESYAVTKSDRLLAVFAEGELTPHIYQNGRLAAILPRNNRMREFYVRDVNGEEFRMFDIDADGIVDFKTSQGRRWIYRHGEFIETPATNTPQGGALFFLDGQHVRLKNGRWEQVEKEEDSNQQVHRTP